MSFDLGNIPWTFWVGLGIFIGLLIGNRKFRDECDAFVARLMGNRNRKKKGSTSRVESDEGECVICGNPGAKAIVFDNNRAVCAVCLGEITGGQVNRPTRRRG